MDQYALLAGPVYNISNEFSPMSYNYIRPVQRKFYPSGISPITTIFLTESNSSLSSNYSIEHKSPDVSFSS